jgi:GTP-dependent phosphoenolpyruvate carboxykinase
MTPKEMLMTTTVFAHPGAPTANSAIIDWVGEVGALATADQVVWCDGRNENQDKL